MTPTRTAAGVFGGFALLAAVNAIAIAVAVPLPAGGIALRLVHHAFDATETLGVGAVAALLVGAIVRLRARLPVWVPAAVGFGASLALVVRIWGDYLIVIAPRVFDGRLATPMLVFWLVILGASLTAAPFAASLLASSGLPGNALALGVALVAMVANQVALRDDYFDAHGVVGLGAALVAGSALGPGVERVGRALARTRAGRAGLVVLGACAVLGIAVPPGNLARVELFRQPCAIATWALATTLWAKPALHGPTTVPSSPWLADRSALPPRPPTSPARMPPDAVVVLLTIDAVRAEVLRDPAKMARLPTLSKLARESVNFTRAYAPGAQTEVSLTSLFSSRYYTEQRWTTYGVGWIRQAHPALDDSPRFPELLSSHGVATVHLAAIPFLANEYGIARGFGAVTMLGHGKSYAAGVRLLPFLIERLRHAGPGPLFLYAHILDPHAPYVEGKRGDPPYQRYLSSIAVVDAFLGRVLSFLEENLGKRWALFVSADHGEAFGEHETTDHGKTLYEELLRVPLLARSPLFSPRSIDTPVGLIDLGPTLLDLFGEGTPATFEGESLVPLLAGGTTPPTRPLFAEGRLRRALIEPDGLKVIDDPRRKVVEVYDLGSDPGETKNLFDAAPERADRGLAELRGFFDVHALREGGYVPPYKP